MDQHSLIRYYATREPVKWAAIYREFEKTIDFKQDLPPNVPDYNRLDRVFGTKKFREFYGHLAGDFLFVALRRRIPEDYNVLINTNNSLLGASLKPMISAENMALVVSRYILDTNSIDDEIFKRMIRSYRVEDQKMILRAGFLMAICLDSIKVLESLTKYENFDVDYVDSPAAIECLMKNGTAEAMRFLLDSKKLHVTDHLRQELSMHDRCDMVRVFLRYNNIPSEAKKLIAMAKHENVINMIFSEFSRV